MNGDLINIPNGDLPDQAQLEEMLSHFKPLPSKRFDGMIENAPWLQMSGQNIKRVKLGMTLSPRLIYGLVFILLIVAVMGAIFIPSLRVIARQIIYSFITSPTNQIEVQVSIQNPGDLNNFSDPSNYSISISEAQRLAGFTLKVPSFLFDELVPVGARFDPSYASFTILYQADSYKLFLTQRPLNAGKDLFSIGPDAKVSLVEIGDQQGEFVLGGWKAVTNSETPSSTGQINISAIWDNDLPQYTLRWHADDISYELRALGEGSPSLSELITLSNELK